MFNNSSAISLVADEKPIEEFDWHHQCLLWNLQNSTISLAQAEEACSMYTSVAVLETAPAVIFCLVGIFIVITNAVVLWGIAVTRELHKPLYFYMSNLATSDIFGGLALVIKTVVDTKDTTWRETMVTATLLFHSQVSSASALALMSVDTYVAVRHPIYFHTHAHTAKRNACITIVSSWLTLSLFDFSPIMGWNCLDMPSPDCLDYIFHISFFGVLAAVFILLISVILFTNISVYVAIKRRQKRRIGQLGGPQAIANSAPGQNVAENEADRKFKKSVQKARTVMFHVVISLVFWVLPVPLLLCIKEKENCPIPIEQGTSALAVFFTLNSVINPIASIVRTPDLRKGIRQNVTSIRQALVIMIRGNRVDPQGE